MAAARPRAVLLATRASEEYRTLGPRFDFARKEIDAWLAKLPGGRAR